MSGALAAKTEVMTAADAALLHVDDLSISSQTDDGRIAVVSDVNFTLMPGKTLGLVGESGCGKSVTAQTLMRLLPMPPAHIDKGRILFLGEDLATAGEN